MKLKPKTFRLHPEVDRLIDELASVELTTRTGVIESAIKEMAKSRKLNREAVNGNTKGKNGGL